MAPVIGAGPKRSLGSQLKDDATEELVETEGFRGRFEIGDFFEHLFGDELFFESGRLWEALSFSQGGDLRVFQAAERGFCCAVFDDGKQEHRETGVGQNEIPFKQCQERGHGPVIHEF